MAIIILYGFCCSCSECVDMSISINKIFNMIPKMSVGDANPQTLNSIADWVSRPAPNRLIMGATALVTQPYIDSHNPRVSEKTREISKDRTTAKVIVGTLAGITVRQPSYDLVTAMTRPEEKGKYSQFLIPRAKLKGLKEGSLFLKNYRTTLSTLLALSVMCITNFAVDAPLTAILTNRFIARTKAKNAKREAINDAKV